jgi:hypothetical protein
VKAQISQSVSIMSANQGNDVLWQHRLAVSFRPGSVPVVGSRTESYWHWLLRGNDGRGLL